MKADVMPRCLRKAARWVACVGMFAAAVVAGPVALANTLEEVRQAEALLPDDAALRERYLRSCVICHTSMEAGAPLTGSIEQWRPRLTKGMDTLVKHAMQGLRAMPPKGLCADCSEADMQALIKFMSQGKEKNR
ncbi:c-type cytochrome [Variovorax dokdonensis]|uniref:C-type cytochrome n=1 Tax=Variovorax dokdonensis TaxID=344883 RepID=A0ABT7NDP7_9BURK|nr:c-type cytochrome [Variovorax dokdonensis]MDM0046079.1 c-type cytochrome [Variovorax dokdonensis]